MARKETALALLLVFVFAISCTRQEPVKRLNEAEAIEIALPGINRDYPGSSTDKGEYTAFFEEGIWTVSPKLQEDEVGGGPSALVSDEKGTVLRTLFTE